MTEKHVRDEIRMWIAASWNLDLTVREWWRLLAEARLTMPAWPAPYGRGWSTSDARFVTEELAAAGTIAPPEGVVGTALAGPTLLAVGDDDQRERYLPPLLRGEESWCQLFSEPGSGSDLASVGTRARRDGGGWIVSGQKIWNSGADVARRGMLLARTDVDAPKAAGITYFLLDMDQPGIDARPLVTMNGEARFCEVFIDDAHIPTSDTLGRVNDGWTVARTTLGYERSSVARRRPKNLVFIGSGEKAGQLDRVVGEVIDRQRDHRPAFDGMAVPARRFFDLARDRGLASDPHIRQHLAHYYTLTELSRIGQLRAQSASASGRTQGPEASTTKLSVSQICHASRELGFSLLGADSMLWGADAPFQGALHTVGLASFGASIGGGTDEVQRNLLGERVLGLPREPQADRDVSYRELQVGTQRGATA